MKYFFNFMGEKINDSGVTLWHVIIMLIIFSFITFISFYIPHREEKKLANKNKCGWCNTIVSNESLKCNGRLFCSSDCKEHYIIWWKQIIGN